MLVVWWEWPFGHESSSHFWCIPIRNLLSRLNMNMPFYQNRNSWYRNDCLACKDDFNIQTRPQLSILWNYHLEMLIRVLGQLNLTYWTDCVRSLTQWQLNDVNYTRPKRDRLGWLTIAEYVKSPFIAGPYFALRESAVILDIEFQHNLIQLYNPNWSVVSIYSLHMYTIYCLKSVSCLCLVGVYLLARLFIALFYTGFVCWHAIYISSTYHKANNYTL